MGVVVIYTHNDMEDVWKPFFGQNQKYISQYKTYICTNKPNDNIPKEYIQIYYDETKPYTERLNQSLTQIDEDVFIFMHEDMILYNQPMYDSIETYFQYVIDDKVDSIKLISVGDRGITSPIDDTLIMNEFSKFSIQPTIIKKQVLMDILKGVGGLNIWDFENAIVGAGMDFMVRIGGEHRRGIYHYDSLVFPYIATAISKGKWSYGEYQPELHQLFEEYNINPFERGIV